MASRLAEFRENPQRSIFVAGKIDQDLVDLLTKQILALQYTSKDPITVYIDSPGGNTVHARLIQDLLEREDQDGMRCRIVTVVTGTAASAAADLLAFGTYAIGYEHAIIHFHGVRTNLSGITHESASSVAEALRRSNEGYALRLADRVLNRFMFIYMQLEESVSQARQNNPKSSEVECLASCMDQKLGGGHPLIAATTETHTRLQELLTHYRNCLDQAQEKFERRADKEVFLLKCIIDWELSRNLDRDWRLESGGLSVIREDYMLLSDYEDGPHMLNFEQQVRTWGSFLLTPKQRNESSSLTEQERDAYLLKHTKPRFKAVWYFLVSLCRALQQGENRLTAPQAYWLGLIDEVPGSGLKSLREVIERQNEVAAGELIRPLSIPSKPAKKRSRKSAG